MADVTFIDLFRGINAYPIPPATLNGLAAVRGLDLNAVATSASAMDEAYRLCRADVLMWLADAPNITQGGQSYSFNEDQRNRFRDEAQAIYEELAPDTLRTKYGYKGSRL